jgi:hypothetical protein
MFTQKKPPESDIPNDSVLPYTDEPLLLRLPKNIVKAPSIQLLLPSLLPAQISPDLDMKTMPPPVFSLLGTNLRLLNSSVPFVKMPLAAIACCELHNEVSSSISSQTLEFVMP